MGRPLIPPRYVSIPAALVYDKRISPAVRDTYVQLRGFAWGTDEMPELSVRKIVEVTGKSRATIYGHLAILRLRGWLLFSSAHHSGLTVQFLSMDVAREESNNLDLLNEDVNLIKPILHLPVNNDLKRADSVQKSGQVSRNLDSDNGWHEAPLTPLGDAKTAIIDAELEDLLKKVGVFPALFAEIAASGWDAGQIYLLAQKVLDELGAGEGGAVFMFRLRNLPRPLTEEERRRSYLNGEYSGLIVH